MKFKVSELEGAKLDYWVARVMGYRFSAEVPEELCGLAAEGANAGCHVKDWTPSIDWSQGGPIIETDKMIITPSGDGDWCAGMDGWIDPGGDAGPRWQTPPNVPLWMHGQTALIAAMRCKVASKYGEEIEE
jgi:hypothetical protein